MTDRLIATSQELRSEGEELSTEIARHGTAFYERICRMQQRLQAELAQLEALRRRFEWTLPRSETTGQQAIGHNLEDQRRALEGVDQLPRVVRPREQGR
jgi:hypothetical protein